VHEIEALRGLTLHDLTLADASALLALNNANAGETSLLDEAGITALLEMAFYARGMEGGRTALLLALDQNAPYANPNFDWFKVSRGSFVYIDRIVVAGSARGLGYARHLYHDLFAAARRAGHCRVVCEVNLDPPNPASDAFHRTMGFDEVGRATIHSGKKTVRYFERLLRRG
jgi:predicted GNAT superfamily acetyltransferase